MSGVLWRKFSKAVLHAALAAKNTSGPIELLVENTDYFHTFKIDYHGSERISVN
jgi:hypothetical protein